MKPASWLLLCSALAMAWACSPATQDDTSAPGEPKDGQLLETVKREAANEAGGDCLLMIWSDHQDSDVDFDRANDHVNGGAISCATGTTPSRFESAIAALRSAANAGDKARLLEQVGVPLLYINDKGERRELTSEEVDVLFDEVFDAQMLETLSQLDLSQMTVEQDQGGFFALGTVWLVVDDTGQPRMMTVNRQALREATEVARRKALRGDGRPLETAN